MSIKSIIMSVIGIVIAVSLTPTIWTAIYTTAVSAGVNGTTLTLLELVPFVYVGVVVIGGIVYAIKG
jgi:hypothetical protein